MSDQGGICGVNKWRGSVGFGGKAPVGDLGSKSAKNHMFLRS